MKTPRTDKESWWHEDNGTEIVDAKFARQLEREVQLLREELIIRLDRKFDRTFAEQRIREIEQQAKEDK